MAACGWLSEAQVYYLWFITCRLACSLFLACIVTTMLEDLTGSVRGQLQAERAGPQVAPACGRKEAGAWVWGQGVPALPAHACCCGVKTHWPLVVCSEPVWGHCSLGWSPDSLAVR